jgi:hypothetical protein
MTTTIDGTNVYFFDGTSFNGNYPSGVITVDTNTSEFTGSYAIGALLFAVNFFYAGNFPGGPSASPLSQWQLNTTSPSYTYNGLVAASQYYGGSTQYLDPKMVFTNGGSGVGLSGTWKARGNPVNKGAQYLLNITMIERVA